MLACCITNHTQSKPSHHKQTHTINQSHYNEMTNPLIKYNATNAQNHTYSITIIDFDAIIECSHFFLRLTKKIFSIQPKPLQWYKSHNYSWNEWVVISDILPLRDLPWILCVFFRNGENDMLKCTKTWKYLYKYHFIHFSQIIVCFAEFDMSKHRKSTKSSHITTTTGKPKKWVISLRNKPLR